VALKMSYQQAEDAEDLVSDTIHAVFGEKKLQKIAQEGLKPGQRFREYLLTTLRYKCTSAWRKKCAQKRGGGKVAMLDEIALNEASLLQSSPEKLTMAIDLEEARRTLEGFKKKFFSEPVEVDGEARPDVAEVLWSFFVGLEEYETQKEAAAALGMSAEYFRQKLLLLRRQAADYFMRTLACAAFSEQELEPEAMRLLALALADEQHSQVEGE
jgi:hypothetical protein